jgi:hypothetical protein
MVKFAGSASARKSEMHIFRLFYSPEAGMQTPFTGYERGFFGSSGILGAREGHQP